MRHVDAAAQRGPAPPAEEPDAVDAAAQRGPTPPAEEADAAARCPKRHISVEGAARFARRRPDVTDEDTDPPPSSDGDAACILDTHRAPYGKGGAPWGRRCLVATVLAPARTGYVALGRRQGRQDVGEEVAAVAIRVPPVSPRRVILEILDM